MVLPEAPAIDGSMQDPSRNRCRVWIRSMDCARFPAWSALPLMAPLPAGPAAAAVVVKAEATRNIPVRITVPSFVFIFLTSFEC